MSWRRKLGLALLIFVVLGALADQILLRAFMGDGMFLGRRLAPFDPPIFHENQRRAFEQLERYLETGQPEEVALSFDAELGWCPPRSARDGDKNFDRWGARVGPAPVSRSATPGVRRVVALGCSYTLGDEVADDETWPYLLDREDDALEVVNLGMSAYGLDQAWLRYRRDGRELGADEVWLGWLPAAALRLGTLYRPVVRHWSGPLLFKPRFRLRDGELELVANPAPSLADVRRLLGSQAQFLAALGDDDLWVHRNLVAYAPAGSSWLHHSGLGRAWLTYAEHLGKEPAQWLERDDSEIRRLVFEVVRGLRDDVERDGARFRLLILPDLGALRYQQREGRGYWSAAVEELRAAGVEVLDLTAACQAAGMLEDSSAWESGSHYSARGNAVIAAELARHLE